MEALDKKKARVASLGRIREFVFGIQDGLISTVGLLTGIQSATGSRPAVILTGLAAVVTGALSMATGSYLSTHAEKEIFDKELKDQEAFAVEEPHEAREGLLEALAGEGLSREAAYRLVKLLAHEKRVFLRTFQEKVLGLGTAEIRDPIKAAAVMYMSFVIGGGIPLLPYLFMEGGGALPSSCLLSSLVLFGVGYWKGLVARRPAFLSGLQFFAVAVGSAGIGFLAGKAFSYCQEMMQ
ncbi:MAG: VIT1/CCC1 transporter family protein [Candidatus Omnitrophica bacterium]|nr:VIT1/CCC1 transporter family protein [Candidatus Omnitrophota bacterium]